ncbi:MAG: dienelactone hydrolase family protein, partial [Bryobacteraceae bacterium]
MRIAILFAFAFAFPSFTQPLPGTRPLTPPADPVAKMVEGIRAYLLRVTEASLHGRKPDRERLRYLIGAVDPRIPFAAPERDGSVTSPAKIAETAAIEVFAVRWPVLDGVTAEGLYFQPKGSVKARTVVLPDAGQQPEESAIAWRLASSGCEVLVPVLIDRNDTWSGNPKFRMTSQPHREYIYRMAFPVGRHIIGYEVQKALAAVDWFAKQSKRPIGIWGHGEGGLLALHAAAIDQRIDAAAVGGYFESRQKMRREPIYRNIWGQLKDFGDAEIASLIAPRKLVVETSRGPETRGPSTADAKRTGGAPGVLLSPTSEAAQLEAERARNLGANIEVV